MHLSGTFLDALIQAICITMRERGDLKRHLALDVLLVLVACNNIPEGDGILIWVHCLSPLMTANMQIPACHHNYAYSW